VGSTKFKVVIPSRFAASRLPGKPLRLIAGRSMIARVWDRGMAAGADEVPGVYKDIRQVMQAQKDLVDIVARFDPKIVRMCGDGSRAED